MNKDQFDSILTNGNEPPKVNRPKQPHISSRTEKTNGNGNQFKSQDLNSDKTPAQSKGIEVIQSQVNNAISGLKQAELTHAAEAFQRLDNQFEVDTDRISQAAELLLDPRVKLATGILKAVDRINSRQEEELTIPFGGYEFELPQIPSELDFSRWYSAGRSDHLLGASGNGASIETPSQPE